MLTLNAVTMEVVIHKAPWSSGQDIALHGGNPTDSRWSHLIEELIFATHHADVAHSVRLTTPTAGAELLITNRVAGKDTAPM